MHPRRCLPCERHCRIRPRRTARSWKSVWKSTSSTRRNWSSWQQGGNATKEHRAPAAAFSASGSDRTALCRLHSADKAARTKPAGIAFRSKEALGKPRLHAPPRRHRSQVRHLRPLVYPTDKIRSSARTENTDAHPCVLCTGIGRPLKLRHRADFAGDGVGAPAARHRRNVRRLPPKDNPTPCLAPHAGVPCKTHRTQRKEGP